MRRLVILAAGLLFVAAGFAVFRVYSHSRAGRALFMAAYKGSPDKVDSLLREGASINYPDEGGMTPLAIAAQQGRVEIVKVLLARGANPNLPDRNGMTALMWACASGNAPVARLLVARGADMS